MPPIPYPRRAVASPVARVALAAVLPPALASGALAWALVAVGGVGQAVLGSAVVPDPDLLVRLLLGCGGVALGLALPAGLLVGVVAGCRRLCEEGALRGLATLGVGARVLAAPILGIALIGGAGWALVHHVVEPAARTALRDVRVAAAVRVQPSPSRPVSLGGWTAVVADGQLRFAGGRWLGTAARWGLTPAATGVVLHLEEGTFVRDDGSERGTFASADVPLPIAAGSGRIHASERTTADLRRQIAVSAVLGRDRYERWILWKRTLLPVNLVLLAVAGMAFGARGRGPVVGVVGAMAVSLWGVVRVADQWIEAVGPGAAAALVLVAGAAWIGVGWGGWRDA